MAKRLLPVLALLLIAGFANAQTATVFGTVNEIVGDQYFPIPFARVTLTGEQHHSERPVVPDIEGKFTLHSVAAGVYDLRVSAVGFDPLHTEIEVADGDSLHVRIRMGDKEIAGIMIEARRRFGSRPAPRWSRLNAADSTRPDTGIPSPNKRFPVSLERARVVAYPASRRGWHRFVTQLRP